MRQIGISPRQQFMGFDHVDVRVSSLELVEKFYDRLMPLLGLTRKRTAFVDSDGEGSRPIRPAAITPSSISHRERRVPRHTSSASSNIAPTFRR